MAKTPKTLPFSAARILAEARKHVGVKESPRGSNRTKFGALYAQHTKGGQNGVAWCGQFIWALFYLCGIDLQRSLGFRWCQYTPTFVDDCRKAGWTVVSPAKVQPGDLVFFDFPDSVKRVQHVGIVTRKVRGGHFLSIEGNTSSGSKGSQSNGDGVYERSRRVSDVKVAFRPPYGADKPKVKAAGKAVTAILMAGALVYGGTTYRPEGTPAPRVTVTKTVKVPTTATKTITKTRVKPRTVVRTKAVKLTKVRKVTKIKRITKTKYKRRTVYRRR